MVPPNSMGAVRVGYCWVMRMALIETQSLQSKALRQLRRRQRLLPLQPRMVSKHRDRSTGSGWSVDLIETVPPLLLHSVEGCSLLEEKTEGVPALEGSEMKPARAWH